MAKIMMMQWLLPIMMISHVHTHTKGPHPRKSKCFFKPTTVLVLPRSQSSACMAGKKKLDVNTWNSASVVWNLGGHLEYSKWSLGNTCDQRRNETWKNYSPNHHLSHSEGWLRFKPGKGWYLQPRKRHIHRRRCISWLHKPPICGSPEVVITLCTTGRFMLSQIHEDGTI